MAKMPRTRQGMARRKVAGAAFNPANGEPHTPAFLEKRKEMGLRKERRVKYATAVDRT